MNMATMASTKWTTVIQTIRGMGMIMTVILVHHGDQFLIFHDTIRRCGIGTTH